MQDILLDILIIGLLVVLFGSIYRGHATVRLRFWLLGWFFVLIHFGVLLLNPADLMAQRVVEAAAESALCLCGSAFILSSSLVWNRGWRFLVPALLLSLPPVLLVCTSLAGPEGHPAAVGAALLTQAALGTVVLRSSSDPRKSQTRARPRVAQGWCAAIVLAGSVWFAREVIRPDYGYGLYAILTELFLINAVLYREDFRRISAGVLSSILGLTAWAAVFAIAM